MLENNFVCYMGIINFHHVYYVYTTLVLSIFIKIYIVFIKQDLRKWRTEGGDGNSGQLMKCLSLVSFG